MNGAGWVPDWARYAIFYHIYPLGFFDAPHRNDRTSEPTPRLADLRTWYDHISGLGANAIYFGPLFESHAHGYDTIDYYSIDRRLGDNTLFKSIVDELHGRGIRVIVDGVFNHTGRGFFAFEDVRQHGQDSQYRDWYLINWGDDSPYHDGFTYDAWHGHQALPRLNLHNSDVRNYIFDVARYWLQEMGVDGWRLDVAHEIDPGFWWEFRRVCKELNPDYFLLGELEGGDYRTLVAPDLLDSGTDYQVYPAIYRSLNDRNFFDLKAAAERAYHKEWGLYRDLSLQNFLGNHDVSRIASELRERRHVFTAHILLLTLPGIPSLYYGDEVGMEGRKDERSDQAMRQPMPRPDAVWPDKDHHLYRQIARLIALRKQYRVLVDGDFEFIDVADQQVSMLRRSADHIAIIIVNAADEAVPVTMHVERLGLGEGLMLGDVLDDAGPSYTIQNGRLEIDRVWPGWARILIADAP